MQTCIHEKLNEDGLGNPPVYYYSENISKSCFMSVLSK